MAESTLDLKALRHVTLKQLKILGMWAVEYRKLGADQTVAPNLDAESRRIKILVSEALSAALEELSALAQARSCGGPSAETPDWQPCGQCRECALSELSASRAANDGVCLQLRLAGDELVALRAVQARLTVALERVATIAALAYNTPESAMRGCAQINAVVTAALTPPSDRSEP